MMWKLVGIGAAVAGVSGTAAADITIVGHRISVSEDGMGSAALIVDGEVLHENGVIFLDETQQTLAGVTVVTGVAGPGGNACGAAPFLLALAEGAGPAFYGPLDSCREFTLQVQTDTLVFATEPLPSFPGEVWVWTPTTGMTKATPREFAADPSLGWEALPSLVEAHPVEAMKLSPVLEALQAGLGADYPAFAERISDLGSGDLTGEGYQGEACLKASCDEDWAVLYLDGASEQPFVIWKVAGEASYRLWPADTGLWPPEAMAVLRDKAAKQ